MQPKATLVVGLGICVLAALAMLADVVDVAWGSVIGVIGLGVIGASAARPDGATE